MLPLVGRTLGRLIVDDGGAAMFGGILHLLFVLILLDMVFEPGPG